VSNGIKGYQNGGAFGGRMGCCKGAIKERVFGEAFGGFSRKCRGQLPWASIPGARRKTRNALLKGSVEAKRQWLA